MSDVIVGRAPRFRVGILGAAIIAFVIAVLLLSGAFTSVANAGGLSSEETAFVKLLNDYRASNGLEPLLVSEILTESADRHASDMSKYGFFSHYTVASDWFAAGAAPWDRMKACGYDTGTHVGENIAGGYNCAATVLVGWKSSASHNAAMLCDDYKVVGVSLIYVAGSQYGYYWTLDLGGIVDSTAYSVGSAPTTTTTTPAPTTTTTTYVSPTTTTTTTAKPTTTTTATPTTGTTVAATVQFSDVNGGTLYADSIYTLASRGVVGGYADGRFGPYDNVTRQQFAKMIILALGYDVSPLSACSFKDVSISAGYADPLYPAGYIMACAAAGITVGTTPDTFSPYNQITRAQLITMVARAAGLIDAPSWYQPPFPNFSATHYPWAMRAAYAGLLDGFAGMGENFNFWAAATRGEVCLVLANLLGQ